MNTTFKIYRMLCSDGNPPANQREFDSVALIGETKR